MEKYKRIWANLSFRKSGTNHNFWHRLRGKRYGQKYRLRVKFCKNWKFAILSKFKQKYDTFDPNDMIEKIGQCSCMSETDQEMLNEAIIQSVLEQSKISKNHKISKIWLRYKFTENSQKGQSWFPYERKLLWVYFRL